jgi:GTP-binding protein
MFKDETRILVSSGRGGDGVVHFRREKYVPHGGPDGGDGGAGGNVILEIAPKMNTLASFRKRHRFQADKGGNGGGQNKTGKTAKDLIIPVPPGTIVYDDESGNVIGDLVEPGQRLIVARRGRGGRGNARYATSRNQAPRMAERGEPGEERWLRLELRLIADVGLIGLPNAGKSTLLAAVTNARPKIASYPFTTLEPNLGVAEIDGENQLVLADIPGLIEGAHMGLGLGFTFLRHVQRTKVLIHLIDGSSPNPLADFSQINAELAFFDEELARKPQIVAINKVDLLEVQERWPELEKEFSSRGQEVMAVSALKRIRLRQLLYAAYQSLQKISPESDQIETPVYRLEPDSIGFKISREPDGAWRVSGKRIERAAEMTYWEFDEAIRRFQKLLEILGIDKELRKAGALNGDTVRIGDYELEWQD